MRRFFIFLYVATAVAQVPFVVAVAHLIGGAAGWLVGVALLAAFVALFRGRVELARWDRHISQLQRHLLEEPYFVHWCASLLALALSVVLVPLALLTGRSPFEACLVAYGSSVPFALWGVLVRRKWVRVREMSVTLPAWPQALDGYRVAQLSDLHVGSHCPKKRVDSWVRRVNALEVDLVALTGDYVTSGVRFHEDIAQALGALQARDGVYAVMGNHDYYGDGEPLMSLLREQGIIVLRNERVRLSRASANVAVVGVDDVFTKRIDIDKATADIHDGDAVLMLAHDPRSFPELAERGCSLVLSGHTHWGQLGVPFLSERLNYGRLVSHYASGLHELNGSKLYVNPGLGTTGPPVRLGSAPEITVITLSPGARPNRAVLD